MAEEQQVTVFAGRTPQRWKAYWQQQLEAEHKRNREWRRDADQIVKRYLDKRKDQGPQYNLGSAEFRVNLFWSNVYTQTSFMASRTPEVQVSRRFNDANDDQARVAANIFQRLLTTCIETDGSDTTTIFQAALEDFLVPGLGVARVRYEAATHTVEHPGTPDLEAWREEKLLYEDAPVDYVHWRDFHWGWGRLWKDVPWVGFDVYLDRDEATRRFGAAMASRLDYKNRQVPAEDENTDNPDLRDFERTARICEIWHKRTQSVFWYHEDVEYILDIQEDPLGLAGFFPCPRPLIANCSTNLVQPQPYFKLAMDLYNEVDQLSTRINIITNAVKVVGAYDKAQSELPRMLQGSIENDLVPVDNWAMLAEKGGLQGVIDWYPVEAVVATLDKLREMRREAIDLLYQVTGLSDIMRGVSEQYAGVAQERLKAQFSGVRIQHLQTEFERWVSDTLTLKAEVVSKHFDPQTIVTESNIQRSYDAQLIGPAIELIKAWAASVWRIKVKPDSMTMVDWAQLKADRAEYITALATFMQSAAPLMELHPGFAPFLLELLKFGLAGFKGGQEIESVIDAAIQRAQEELAKPRPPEPDSEQMKSQLKMRENQQKARLDLMKQADKSNRELQKLVTQFQVDLAKIEAEARADAVGEVVQANQNIREIRAKGRAGGS